eukprot:CAMPEP_0175997238 /NCGR_PEP_ID=MMETSP0108-20121206/56094_1 /TAXON_ID=195067 ORGANISM="Goniomonas pacifica, Strain CCMP1869" /NCGR_SAMPLE_ID=MMETSP0108 /ASSEMBLY_ACC=CAM_ASM_000204 /LENGTH=188 /DNA_ID=CAMNT_0017329485 /DNA_START=103 /DNA_END=670 /DNA_ORIENTATION=+
MVLQTSPMTWVARLQDMPVSAPDLELPVLVYMMLEVDVDSCGAHRIIHETSRDPSRAGTGFVEHDAVRVFSSDGGGLAVTSLKHVSVLEKGSIASASESRSRKLAGSPRASSGSSGARFHPFGAGTYFEGWAVSGSLPLFYSESKRALWFSQFSEMIRPSFVSSPYALLNAADEVLRVGSQPELFQNN